jgi:hypothetical protein
MLNAAQMLVMYTYLQNIPTLSIPVDASPRHHTADSGV